jgi:predicted DNA-binding transcriptional regulator AlpA
MASPTTAPATRRLIDSAQLKARLPIGRTTFYELIKRPEFPTPVVLTEGGDYFWFEDEVDAWLETKRRHPGVAADEGAGTPTSEPAPGPAAASSDDTAEKPLAAEPAPKAPRASERVRDGLVPIAKGARKPGPASREPLTAEMLRPRGVKSRPRRVEERA